ncbi:ankyrin repeat domain-containing protein [Candidatus Dependentiae bacterium]|nr:ankyrin repeat domain-containing protein [Candidatus Dependentiae bacterium]
MRRLQLLVFYCVLFLLDSGGCVLADDYPLHAAVARGDLNEVGKLIDKTNVNTKDLLGCTPLHVAVGLSFKIVDYLLSRGADLEARCLGGKTPLHIAAESGSIKSLERLIEWGSDINARDEESRTSLHLAAAGGHKESAALLLDKGANINEKDNNEKTPLQLVLLAQGFDFYERAETAKMLIALGAMQKADVFYKSDILNLVKEKGLLADLALSFCAGDVGGRDPEFIIDLLATMIEQMCEYEQADGDGEKKSVLWDAWKRFKRVFVDVKTEEVSEEVKRIRRLKEVAHGVILSFNIYLENKLSKEKRADLIGRFKNKLKEIPEKYQAVFIKIETQEGYAKKIEKAISLTGATEI